MDGFIIFWLSAAQHTFGKVVLVRLIIEAQLSAAIVAAGKDLTFGSKSQHVSPSHSHIDHPGVGGAVKGQRNESVPVQFPLGSFLQPN